MKHEFTILEEGWEVFQFEFEFEKGSVTGIACCYWEDTEAVQDTMENMYKYTLKKYEEDSRDDIDFFIGDLNKFSNYYNYNVAVNAGFVQNGVKE